MRSCYLQTDFDVTSLRSLGVLHASLAKSGLVEVNAFRRGRLWCAGFESARSHKTAEQSVRAILKTLDALAPKARGLLRACSTRHVDIAFEVGPDLKRFTEPLSAATIMRLAKHDVGVRVTLYKST